MFKPIVTMHASKLATLLVVTVLIGSCQVPDDSTPPAETAPDEDLGTCLDFEDLTLGDTFVVGDTIVTSSAQVGVGDFTFGGGGTTSDGFTEVEAGGLAGGSGQELELNNVLLAFDFGGPVESLSIRFGEYGGNLNLEVNGDFRNFEDFADVDGTNVGGVDVSVTGGLGNDQGVITLSGIVDALSLGGQELWIDDVCSPSV